jgi:hypothetical protein
VIMHCDLPRLCVPRHRGAQDRSPTRARLRVDVRAGIVAEVAATTHGRLTLIPPLSRSSRPTQGAKFSLGDRFTAERSRPE